MLQLSVFFCVQGLLPRGEYPNHLSDRNSKVNEIVKRNFDGSQSVEVICSGDILRQSNGRISRKDMYDFLHLTEQGYIKTFSPVLEKLQEIFKASF